MHKDEGDMGTTTDMSWHKFQVGSSRLVPFKVVSLPLAHYEGHFHVIKTQYCSSTKIKLKK